MTLPQERENILKKYKGLTDDDPSVIEVSAVPCSEVFAVQGQHCPLGSTDDSNNTRYECTKIKLESKHYILQEWRKRASSLGMSTYRYFSNCSEAAELNKQYSTN